MSDGRGWRWAGLAAIGAFAALFTSFNAGERVALNLGFMVLYRIPLVLLIFLAFLAGMITMFLLGLRHDMRVRRALREAGFGEQAAVEEAAPRWEDDETEREDVTDPVLPASPDPSLHPPEPPSREHAHPRPPSDMEPPLR